MNFIFLIGVLLLSFVLGVWILLLLYGVEGGRSLFVAFVLPMLLPNIFMMTTKLVVRNYCKEYGLSRLKAIKLSFNVFGVCFLLIPIILNDSITSLANIQNRKRKKVYLKKAKEKLCVALSDCATQYYALQNA